MNLSPQEFLPHEDMDAEVFNLEEFPWGSEAWEERDALFDSLETVTMLKSLPTQEELLALDTLNSPLPGDAELESFEDFALGEY